MKAKEKKAGSKPARLKTLISDEEAAQAANQVCEKELAELNGGKLPELTDAGAEILQATEQHEVAERETAAALAQNDKANGMKPNGQASDAKPVKHLLTEEAHKLRKQLVNDPRRRRAASDTEVQKYFLAKGYSPEGKQVTKADLVAYMQEMETAPYVTSSRMFSEEAFQKIVKHLRNEVKNELFKRFDKQTGVGITDDLLLAIAEATVAVDKDLNLEIDGDFETCFIESCEQRRFVPLRGVNAVKKGNQTEFKSFGNFLYVEPNEKNGLTTPEVRPHCGRCSRASRIDAKANGQWVVFLPKTEAQKRAQGWLDYQRRREERSFSVGAAVRAKESRKDERPSGKQPGKFNPELAAKCQNPFAALLNNREKDYPVGRYYSPEFEMQDKRTGKVVRTFLDLAVSKHSLVVSDAGLVLADLVDTTHNTGYFENKLLYVGLLKAADAQPA